MNVMRSVGTLTRADLAETINHKMGFSRAESLDMVEAILAKMCDAMSDGENVKISGFGSFVLRDKKERIGRNPKTGEKVLVPAKLVPAVVKEEVGLPELEQPQQQPRPQFDPTL